MSQAGTGGVGKIFLVGAGPGHPELITVKGLALVRQADAIVYDRLIQEDMLAAARPDAELVYAGKAPSRHESRQHEINELLLGLARRHKLVVRLKGGDPLLLGRGGEEAEYLARNGVPFEIVPGVTAALAAPAAAGIPVTHRDLACTLAVVTGHEKDSAEQGRIDWNALAKVDTLVVLMGVHAVERIAARLIEAGRSPNTPVALIEAAFWTNERTIEATLGTVAAVVANQHIEPPATLVVGDVVKIRQVLGSGERELLRTASAAQPSPGPSAAEIDRLVAALWNARHLAAALELRLFDDLDEPRSPAHLASTRGLATTAVEAVCHGLAKARLLVEVGSAVRNTELATRFLRTDSPHYCGEHLRQSIRAALAWDLAQPWATPGATPEERGR
ncbi:MAG: uroporphyrinogen-III C-methyltransferase [Pseudomonadota bacterium]